MPKEHDKIATRLTHILIKFNSKERFTIDELCEEFAVNKRTIQRDLHERLSYLPIIKENGYYFMESFAFGSLSFEDIKAFATLSGIRSLYPALTNNFITDLLNTKTNQAYLIKSFGHENLSPKQELFENLSASILKSHKIKCTYKEKERLLNPYKLINTNGMWYLSADENGVLKTFSFSKMKNLQFTTDTFIPNSEFIDTIAKNEANWFSQDKIEVTLQIDNQVAEYFLRRKILPNQTIIEHNENHLILTTNVSYENEILSVLKYWLPYGRILEPKELQVKFEKILEDYLMM
jgi:predicted DNA-binding transcriptional regulator YafY